MGSPSRVQHLPMVIKSFNRCFRVNGSENLIGLVGEADQPGSGQHIEEAGVQQAQLAHADDGGA